MERQRLDENIIKSLVGQMRDAWNRGDLKAFCSAFSTEAQLMNKDGRRIGRAIILAYYQLEYPTQAEMGTLAARIINVELPMSLQVDTKLSGVTTAWSVRTAAGTVSGYSLMTVVEQYGQILVSSEASVISDR